MHREVGCLPFESLHTPFTCAPVGTRAVGTFIRSARRPSGSAPPRRPAVRRLAYRHDICSDKV
eukprot:351012-Chlamydomonas_euryale.AAC.7